MKDVQDKCIGYFYSWNIDDLASIGSENDKKIITFSIISQIQPITRLESMIHGLTYYWEIDKLALNERQSKKREKRDKQNSDKIIIYHTPLNHNRIVQKW